jgi:hypothetical protein
MLIETFIVLAIWLAFVWFCDPDGFRRHAEAKRTSASNSREERTIHAGDENV